MRFIASTLLGLACVAVAAPTAETSSSDSCTTVYDACRAAGIETEGTCTGNLSHCKDSCASTYSQTGDLTTYNTCLDTFTASAFPDCASAYSTCLTTNTTEATCNSNADVCKNACSVVLDACSSSGDSSVTTACQSQYSTCLDAFLPLTQSSCATQYTDCRSNGLEDNYCNYVIATCKDSCGTLYDIANTAGDESTASQALTQYNTCLDDFSSSNINSTDCVTKYQDCRASGGLVNDCKASAVATCKVGEKGRIPILVREHDG